METSSISIKPTLHPKISQVSETGKQPPQSNRPDKLAANSKLQAVKGDTVSLSSESLLLAKSTNAQPSTKAPAIESRGQAQQAVQSIVEKIRQQPPVALESQGGITGNKLKSLLA